MAKKTPSSKTTARKSMTGTKAPSAKRKNSTTKKSGAAQGKSTASTSVGETEVTIDRRRNQGRRTEDAADHAANPAAPVLERRQKVNRRRQIDPTTCERDYTDDEVEFMNALDVYKRKSGRMFPTCSEVLEVIRGLGYMKLTASEFAARDTTDAREEQGHEDLTTT